MTSECLGTCWRGGRNMIRVPPAVRTLLRIAAQTMEHMVIQATGAG